VNGREFLRQAKRYARRHRLEYSFDPGRGKGSHGVLTIGNHETVVQRGEIAPNTLASMFRDLNINRRGF
jgi:hypothetical protein